MLIKLFKFDFKSNIKIQMILILSALAMIPLFIFINLVGNNILNSVITTAAIISSIVIFVCYASLQIVYFVNAMIGRESYFIHTLPTDTNQILLSKILSALVWGATIILSIGLCWFCYFKIYKPDIPGVTSDIISPIAIMSVCQFIYLTTLIAFSTALTVHHRLTHISRIVIGIAAYFVISNVCSILMLFCIGIQLYLKGELSSFLANEWPNEKAIDFVYQVFHFVSIGYIALAGLFYWLAVRVFKRYKSI